MTFKSAALTGILSAAVFATALPAHALTIDSFNCVNHSVSTTTDGVGVVASNTQASNPSCVINDGSRELAILDVSGTGGDDESKARVSSGLLKWDEAGTVDSILRVTWSNIGTVDLTEGGVNKALGLMVTFIDQYMNVRFSLTDTSNNTASHTISNIGGPGLVLFEFSNFIGANLASIKTIQMFVDGPASIDPQFDYVNATVPEPATFMLLGLGLLGIGAKRALRKA